MPFAKTPIPNPDEPGNNNQTVLPPGRPRLRRPRRREPPLRRQQLLLPRQRRGARPRRCARRRRPTAATSRPPRRPDVPCETQEPPNLNAPGGSLAEFGSDVPVAKSGFNFGKSRPINAAKIQRGRRAAQEVRRDDRAEEAPSACQRELKQLAELGAGEVRRAIRKHLGDFIAILALFVLALGHRRLHPVQPAAALPVRRGEAVHW